MALRRTSFQVFLPFNIHIQNFVSVSTLVTSLDGENI
jgi:hypothetical protein